MFRLFLRKKLMSWDQNSAPVASETSATAQRNRRVFARYNIDYKHLKLMNEQDILLVRDISSKGCSTEVSPRSFERLMIGDIYDARMRYISEIYDLNARVAWKQGSFIGFEIVDPKQDTMVFLRRLLRPIEIAASLKPVATSFTSESADGKTWYHGDNESDLYVWHDPEAGHLTAWQLTTGNQYVEWSEIQGLQTGNIMSTSNSPASLISNLFNGLIRDPDTQPNKNKKQFAIDIIMALPYPERETILKTLAE